MNKKHMWYYSANISHNNFSLFSVQFVLNKLTSAVTNNKRATEQADLETQEPTHKRASVETLAWELHETLVHLWWAVTSMTQGEATLRTRMIDGVVEIVTDGVIEITANKHKIYTI